jgi:protein-S-isoprenylcysteine O-methyltransferase Ste14
MTPWNKLAQKLRVPVGTILGILFLLLMHPSARSLWIGAAIAVPGSLLRLWAAGHIEKGRVLTQGGPYAFTRNPLYLGSFFMALGIITAGQGYWLLPAFAVFFVIFYFPVMRAEEQEMLAGYG